MERPYGGGIYCCRIHGMDGPFTISNTIIGNSTSGGAIDFDFYPYAAVGPSNLIADDIPLGDLADNGGPTQTMALLPRSPAIDGGDDAVCAAAPVNNLDQRGSHVLKEHIVILGHLNLDNIRSPAMLALPELH